jgi:hypothetical protein
MLWLVKASTLNVLDRCAVYQVRDDFIDPRKLFARVALCILLALPKAQRKGHAAAIKYTVIGVKKTIGKVKKYVQLKIVTATKQRQPMFSFDNRQTMKKTKRKTAAI